MSAAGKIVVLTGASAGIGAAAARQLHRDGATVIPVAAVTNIAVGDVLVIGAAGFREFRTVLSIAALNVTLVGALTLPHASADPVNDAPSATTSVAAHTRPVTRQPSRRSMRSLASSVPDTVPNTVI